MTRLLIILLFAIVKVVTATGQQKFLLRPDKNLPKDKQWKALQLQNNSVPTERLKIIEHELDSTISVIDCYKFIYSADSSKFLAFFIMRKDNPKFNRLIHFGRTVRQHYHPSINDSIQYLAYILWGMRHEKNWYYHKDRENEFWEASDKPAKDDFLFYVLDDIGFFKRKDKESFWENGGTTNQFRILPEGNSYLEEYVGLPELVGWHKASQARRQKDLLNEQVEKIACEIQDDLWHTLHRLDSASFHSRCQSNYTDQTCLTLYSSDRVKVLLPLIYFDNKKQPWVTYYFLKINTTDTALYQWIKLPPKRIRREPGKESLEIVYDIRTFIESWSWGTVNMISTDSFWVNNFTDRDLRLLFDNVR
jgi:hypothetical protein